MYPVKGQHAYISFNVFYTCFCMCVFYAFPFTQLNAGPMALPTGDRQQCHPNVGQDVKMDTKLISHNQIMNLFLIF